jgi:outer membrane protein OmpA-like peptidoglycan-associated protein
MPAFEQQQSRTQSSLLASPARPDRANFQPALIENSLISQQQAFGNRAMQRLVRSKVIQAKFTINEPGDQYEQEADRVADAVMRMPDPGTTDQAAVGRQAPGIQRRCSECEEELHRQPMEEEGAALGRIQPPRIQRVCSECEEELHRQPVEEEEEGETLLAKEVSGQTPEVTPDVQAKINALRGRGRPLPDSDRRFFEPRFGRDFNKVRIHTGDEASVAARSVDALAYTMGSDVVFGQGQYRPGTEDGRKLLAHELAHVIQQGADGTPSLQRQHRGVPSQAPAGLLCQIPTNSPLFRDTDVLFSLGSSTLTHTAIADIASVATRWNAADADKFVRVDGYASIYEGEKISTEPVDPLAEIWTLSCDRAMMVEQELMSPSSGARGIPASFIEVFAWGDTSEGISEPPHTRAKISAEIPARPPALSGTGCRSCPFFCGHDQSKPLESYNCSGLAFRTYLHHDLNETKQALARGSDVSCGTPCHSVGMIKFWLWEYDAHEEDSSGRVLYRYGRTFHMVGGPTAGDPLPKDSDAFYSKNNKRPVDGPGTAPSFRPPARERATSNEPAETPAVDNQGNPTYWVRWNLKESCYCFPCPKDLNDARW